MAREYARVHDYYVQLHELQPPQHFHHYDLQANTGALSAYEVTAGVGIGDGGLLLSPNGMPHTSLHQLLPHQTHVSHTNHHDECKRKPTLGSGSDYDMPRCETRMPSHQSSSLSAHGSATRKRKAPSSYCGSSVYDDDGNEDSRSVRTLPDKKQNHSEIEKRRRDKMNTYITELSAMVPMCGAMSRKLDKLTVLRMAVQHLRSVRGSLTVCPLAARPRPAFLSERELNALVLRAAQACFLLVVGCDRGRLLYVSASVKHMLHYDQTELLGQSLFDILHPKDVAKVKEQLSSSDLSPRERLIDAKTMLPLKADVVAGASRLCPGARRSFFCRIKCKATPERSQGHNGCAPTTQTTVKQEGEPNAKMRKKQSHEKKYCVVQCTGYLKSWASVEMGDGSTEMPEDGEGCNMSCLVAVARALPDIAPQYHVPPTRHLQYVSRHAIDGKFLFVDHRVTLALGFLPQELLGTSLYEYVHGPDLSAVARTHKSSLLSRDALHTPPYRFRRKDGTLMRLQTHFKPFRNPWTKDVECLVANNTLVSEELLPEPDQHTSYDIYKQKCDTEMQRLIDSHVESHKIGSAIAEEALRRSAEFSPDLPADILHDAVFNQGSLVDMLAADNVEYSQVRNNVPLSSAGCADSPPVTVEEPMVSGTPPPASPPLPPLDGNGEAAMAVIMSLLEADAGLGGPINFSGLPWPLP